MYAFHTEGFNGYAVQYSPFIDSRLAVASSANFGLVGNGRLYILGLTPQGIQFEKKFDTQDGLFDCSWSELHENQIVVASGDGSIKLFDVALKDLPLSNWREHKREVFSVHWNLIQKETFCSSSWDTTVKIWHPTRPNSLHTFQGHTACVYQALFSPHDPHIIGSCSGDSTFRTWDERTGSQGISFVAHPNSEVLAFDWNKYKPGLVHTAGVDRSIKTWDIRNTARELCIFRGHDYAIRKVVSSPHFADVIASASYDMTVRVWHDMPPQGPVIGMGRQEKVWGMHQEFVVGLDWSLFGSGGWLATCGWDEKVYAFDAFAN